MQKADSAADSAATLSGAVVVTVHLADGMGNAAFRWFVDVVFV